MCLGYTTEKATSAEAAELCSFTEQRESNPAARLYRRSPRRYLQSGIEELLVLFVYCFLWKYLDSRRLGGKRKYCLSASAFIYVQVRTCIRDDQLYMQKSLERTTSLVYIFCKAAYGEKSSFFDVILTLKMEFPTLSCGLY